MRRMICWIACSAVLALGQGLAQSSLPPEVIRLAQIKRQMALHLERTSNLACLETINRVTLNRTGKQKQSDTVRAEVAFLEGREMFSWPGEERFDERNLSEIVGLGTTSSGGFVSLARTIFLNYDTQLRFAGDVESGGRTLHRYDYKVSLLSSGYTLNIAGESGKVPYSGSLWADSKTLDVTRLTVSADDIPPNVAASAVETRVEYGRVKLGQESAQFEILLPQQVEVAIHALSGGVSKNTTEFSHCREFRGISSVRFTEEPESLDPAPQAVATLEKVTLPHDLRLILRLETPVSSESAAVGDRLRAVTTSAVKHKGEVIVPAGAKLRGRVRWLERQDTHYVIGLEFSRIEWAGKQGRFLARLEAVQDSSGRMRMYEAHSWLARTSARQLGYDRLQRTQQVETMQFRDLPGVALLTVTGSSFELPAGLQLSWTTLKQ
jgi:hypothetical protein